MVPQSHTQVHTHLTRSSAHTHQQRADDTVMLTCNSVISHCPDHCTTSTESKHGRNSPITPSEYPRGSRSLCCPGLTLPPSLLVLYQSIQPSPTQWSRMPCPSPCCPCCLLSLCLGKKKERAWSYRSHSRLCLQACKRGTHFLPACPIHLSPRFATRNQ